MRQKEFFSLGLPKWPCLLVSGKKVTREQAAVILIRTDDWMFSSNDHELNAELRKIAGLKPDHWTVRDRTPEIRNAPKQHASPRIWMHDRDLQAGIGIGQSRSCRASSHLKSKHG